MNHDFAAIVFERRPDRPRTAPVAVRPWVGIVADLLVDVNAEAHRPARSDAPTRCLVRMKFTAGLKTDDPIATIEY